MSKYDFNTATSDSSIYVLVDVRNEMYFKRFAYDTDRKVEVTDELHKSKRFETKASAADYIITHNLENHFEIHPITT